MISVARIGTASQINAKIELHKHISRISFRVKKIQRRFEPETQFVMNEHIEILEKHEAHISAIKRVANKVAKIKKQVCDRKHACYIPKRMRVTLKQEVVKELLAERMSDARETEEEMEIGPEVLDLQIDVAALVSNLEMASAGKARVRLRE